MKNIFFFLIIICCGLQTLAQEVINPKGTKILIDTSKWKITGNNIYFKNSGNIGIGTTTPTTQLHTTNTVRFQGIGTNTTDTKILTADATGNITTRLLSTLPSNIDSTTSNNGLALTGKNIQLGGNLIQATTITNNTNPFTIATGGSAFSLTGLIAGNTTDSILTLNTNTGRVNRININTLNKVDSTTSNNGLTLSGKNIQLGGSLIQATAIANNGFPLKIATGGADLSITGLTSGAITDSLLTINSINGKVNRLSFAALNKIDSTTSNNGLTLTGKNVQLGGNLTQATTITNNANPLTIATGGTAFNITGLTAGAITDSLITINTITGKINRINISTLNKVDSTTASNGINLVGKDVRLGGNLTQATTISNNANPLTIATAGTALNITGLPSGTIADSILVQNNATGQLKKLNASEFQIKIAQVYDNVGIQTLGTTFTNLNFGTNAIIDAGYTAVAGAITVANTGVYKITYRVTANVTTNITAGGEFTLTFGGVPIPGTLGYTFHNNNNAAQGTVTVVAVVPLPANTTITVQGRRYTTNGNLLLTANGSSLLIEKIR